MLVSCLWNLLRTAYNLHWTAINQSNKQTFGVDNGLRIIPGYKPTYRKVRRISDWILSCIYRLRRLFDCLKHSFLFTSLQQQEVLSIYLNIITDIYKNSSARLMLEKPGEFFRVQKGVKLGDSLSPLFLIQLCKKFSSNYSGKISLATSRV